MLNGRQAEGTWWGLEVHTVVRGRQGRSVSPLKFRNPGPQAKAWCFLRLQTWVTAVTWPPWRPVGSSLGAAAAKLELRWFLKLTSDSYQLDGEAAAGTFPLGGEATLAPHLSLPCPGPQAVQHDGWESRLQF